MRHNIARVDMHVHSTYSDGTGTIEDNVAAAEQAGMTVLGCVDHVRRDTAWVPDFVKHVRRMGSTTGIWLRPGVEAKILDRRGHLDLPPRLDGVDFILAADHQFPGADGPIHPRVIRDEITAGRLDADDAIDQLVEATAATMHRYPGVQLAHLFSILPKLGFDESSVSPETAEYLAGVARETGAVLEISERHRCPTTHVARAFLEAGVPIVLSTDSHEPGRIGRYFYCHKVVEGLRREVACV